MLPATNKTIITSTPSLRGICYSPSSNIITDFLARTILLFPSLFSLFPSFPLTLFHGGAFLSSVPVCSTVCLFGHSVLFCFFIIDSWFNFLMFGLSFRILNLTFYNDVLVLDRFFSFFLAFSFPPFSQFIPFFHPISAHTNLNRDPLILKLLSSSHPVFPLFFSFSSILPSSSPLRKRPFFSRVPGR